MVHRASFWHVMLCFSMFSTFFTTLQLVNNHDQGNLEQYQWYAEVSRIVVTIAHAHQWAYWPRAMVKDATAVRYMSRNISWLIDEVYVGIPLKLPYYSVGNM